MRLRLVSHAQRAVVVGHAQATSCLTRHRLIGQVAPPRSGHVLSYPIRIEWGKGEGFLPQSLTFPRLLRLLLK